MCFHPEICCPQFNMFALPAAGSPTAPAWWCSRAMCTCVAASPLASRSSVHSRPIQGRPWALVSRGLAPLLPPLSHRLLLPPRPPLPRGLSPPFRTAAAAASLVVPLQVQQHVLLFQLSATTRASVCLGRYRSNMLAVAAMACTSRLAHFCMPSHRHMHALTCTALI